MNIAVSPEFVNNTSVSIEVLKFFDFAQTNKFALLRLDRHKKFSTDQGWQAGFSKDRADWEKWIAEGFNVGVHAGASRLITFDLDSKHGGIEAVRQRFDAWCISNGMAPLPHHVETASSGQHVYMQVADGVSMSGLASNLSGKIGTGIDVLIGNRQSVAPGSYFDGTPEGKPSGTYSFNDAPLYEAPQSVLKFCTPESRTLDSAPLAPSGYDQADAGKMLEYLTEHDEFASYDEWLRCGMALRAEFGDDGIALWATTHNATVTPDVVATKWNSFDSDTKAGAVTIRSLFDRAHKLGWKGTVRQSISTMFSGVAQLTSAPSLAPAAIGYDMASMPLPKTEEEAAADSGYRAPCYPAQFGDDHTPPEYLIDGFLQRRYVYTITGQTDAGKTNVGLRIIAHVATGLPLNGLEVERGTVLYFAGENPEDIKDRWFGLTREMGLDPKKTDVIFVFGVVSLSKTIDHYRREFEANGVKLAMAIVDTAAAYFEGDNDNDNVQMGNHARVLRSLRYLPGDPCVLVLAHPTKGAKTLEEMTPRGGGAFLNEVDGNCGLVRDATGTIVMAKVGKFRGREFAPFNFTLKVINDHPRLVDSKGRQQTTVVAEPVSYAEVQRREEKSDKDSLKVIRFVDDNPGKSLEAIGTAHGWTKRKAQGIVDGLMKEKLVIRDPITKALTLTAAAQRSLNALESAVPTAVPTTFPVPQK